MDPVGVHLSQQMAMLSVNAFHEKVFVHYYAILIS